MVLKFLGIFFFRHYLIYLLNLLPHPLQLLFRITMPAVPQNYENLRKWQKSHAYNILNGIPFQMGLNSLDIIYFG